ncbi:pseudouridine synthase [Hymenobacter mucosus]|uniref:Pseudouridine synthase n=1 Tax=Hymenobacter mucosus TaxID=1411120 RepID=A0A238WSI8_9BACT|nr:pseudouridine synthase [Hymenobacter mucosus]SNR49530.1 23S rRNA pseudouridine2605 synthase [Hymenobacter mucosus]
MGKKHYSGDAPNRRPSRTAPGSEGSRKFSGSSRDDRSTSGGARFGSNRSDAPNDRSGFGRSTGSGFGGPKKFGTSNSGGSKKFGATGSSFGQRPSSGRDFNRSGEGRPGGFGQRSGAGRDFSNERAPRRFDDRRDNDRSGEEARPVRPYEARKTWQGQPYQQEGKPTVPRGAPGERNRKFNKQNPYEQDAPAPRSNTFAPRPDAGFDRSRDASGPDREVRSARPFDYRGRPSELDANEQPPRRQATERREGGYGGGSFGEKRTARPSGYSADRDTRGTGEKRFGGTDRRDERPTRSFEERPARNKHTGRDLDSNQAGKRKRGDIAGEAPDYKNLKFYEEDKTRGNKRRREEDDQAGDLTRLNRYIANAGICSRREADALIAAGEIRVNGEVVTEMGYKVQPTDTVQYGKTNLNREKQVYVLLNKPKDFITTTDDPEGRRTVMELVAGASKERIFPVGRLDRNTTGLLLFTNDGEVAQKLSHPSNRNKKIYQVELDKPLTEEHLRQIAEGLELEDGKAEVDDVAVVAGNAHFVGIEIHTGRNRIVRRIFEHLGYDVVTLDRVQYAGLTKKDLPRGKWRFLNEKEVIRLKYFM